MDVKEQILSFVKLEGPVLPVQISKKINSNIIFAGAILSELVSNKLIKITYAKIGGSPIYYVDGQEEKLKRLYDYLPGKEKEAYDLLKEKKILKDDVCEPSIRVALRQLKDFAIPFKVSDDIFWKWYLSKDEEITNLLKKPKEPSLKKNIREEKPEVEIKKEIKKKTIKKIKEKKNELLEEINSYLNLKKIELLETKNVKKNEINMTIKFGSDLGELNYFLYAKNKKRINDSDLRLAYSKGQQRKLPVLFLSSGELTKKAQKYLENLKGYLMFRKL